MILRSKYRASILDHNFFSRRLASQGAFLLVLLAFLIILIYLCSTNKNKNRHEKGSDHQFV